MTPSNIAAIAGTPQKRPNQEKQKDGIVVIGGTGKTAAAELQEQIEAALQLHFSAVADRDHAIFWRSCPAD